MTATTEARPKIIVGRTVLKWMNLWPWMEMAFDVFLLFFDGCHLVKWMMEKTHGKLKTYPGDETHFCENNCQGMIFKWLIQSWH